MSTSGRQIALLLRNALRMDFRSRGGRMRRRGSHPFAIQLGFYLLIGTFLGTTLTESGLPLQAQATLVYAFATILLVLNLMVEYQDILLAPTDTEVLGWRPIASKTLYLARVLHVFLYVGLLCVAILLVPSIMIAARSGSHAPLTWLAFAIAGLANGLFATAIVLLLHGVLLRRLSPERFQDTLGNVQLVVMVGMVLVYQLLTPQVLAAVLGEDSRWRHWLRALPAGWFAALPALAAGAREPWLLAVLGLAIAVFALAWAYAVRRLAPAYQLQIEGVRAAAGITLGDDVRLPGWQRLAGGWLAGQPLRRLGFDFFLAQLRGDRKVRLALMPVFALPVGLLLAALLLGGGADPYASHAEPAAWFRHMERDAARETGMRAEMAMFSAVYILSTLMLGLGRSVGRCADWRAAWVFHAAPLRRYDLFYTGVLWGIFAALLLPCLVVVSGVLLVVWRAPLHVAAHLALPLGFALLALPVAHLFDFTPPFSEEPVRHARSRELLYSFVVMIPLIVVAGVHWWLRDRPGVLVGVGLALAGFAALVATLLVRRLRNVFLHRAFEG